MARFFCIFHALSFELNLFFDRRFSLTIMSSALYFFTMELNSNNTTESSKYFLFKRGNLPFDLIFQTFKFT